MGGGLVVTEEGFGVDDEVDFDVDVFGVGWPVMRSMTVCTMICPRVRVSPVARSPVAQLSRTLCAEFADDTGGQQVKQFG